MKHRDFVIYVRNGVEINALVALSQDVFTPATQETPAFTTQHLTLVYLDPASEAQRMTGDQLRASIKTVFDVAPLVEGAVNGWKPLPEAQGSGSDRYASWTEDGDGTGYPGDAESLKHARDVLAEQDKLVDRLRAQLAETTEGKDAALQALADERAVRKPSAEEAIKQSVGNLDTGLGNHVEGQPLSGGIPPAEDVVQTDPAIAEATANPTE